MKTLSTLITFWKRAPAYPLAFALALGSPTVHGDADLDRLEQQALNAAVETVADAVVQINTVGGLERVGRTLIADGPTTGLVISADGYIVSSAFNFARQPTSILVRLPSGKQSPVKLVARDKNRMLVLLKADVDEPLPVVEASPRHQIRVGQWSVALGRTFRADRVGISVGIVSALNRMYGRVLQTDASVSAANYGGPLIDIQGRVLGVLVPMSPQPSGDGAESEVAGAEFYDSGIGFAVPLEHVLAMLERWKQGKDLLPGKLGVGFAGTNIHEERPTIATLWPRSPAAAAGWQPKDRILAIEGLAVETLAQLRFQIAQRYAGDTLNITLGRGEEKLETRLTLTGELLPYQHAFLGVLPAREAKPDGVGVRGVWPESPAAEAGLRLGDRITKIGDADVQKLDDAREALKALHPENSVAVTVVRDEQELALTANLSGLPEEILSAEDLWPANSVDQEKADDRNQLELLPLKLPGFPQEANYFLPKNETVAGRRGLLIWLCSGKSDEDLSIAQAWQTAADRYGLILLLVHPQEPSRWASDDLEYLQRLSQVVLQRFQTDRQRVIVGGQGKAGQLAFALAFRQRNLISGVVGVDAPLPRTLKIPSNHPNQRLAVLSAESQSSTFALLIRNDLQKLREAGYPTSWLQRLPTSATQESLDANTRGSIARWIDALDRF